MESRKYIVGLVFVVLLIWGPLDHSWPAWLAIRIAYLILVPLGVWFLLGWIWRNWQPDPALSDVASSAFFGVLLLLGMFWFWHFLAGNPFDDLALILKGHTVPGFVVDTWEDVESSETGAHWFHGAVYTYRLSDGREFTQHTRIKSGRTKLEFTDINEPVPIEVEYLPDNPAVSRIKGDGSPTLFDWLWRKLGLGGILLVMFLAPGFAMLRDAAKKFVEYRRASAEHPATRT